MKPLPEMFRKDGFTFSLVRRRGKIAIYAKTKLDHHEPSYEVGLIRQNKARTTFGKDFEASESWPTSEEWGVKAWTYSSLSDALKRFGSLEGPNAGNAESHKNNQ